jgi:hypothetical protein
MRSDTATSVSIRSRDGRSVEMDLNTIAERVDVFSCSMIEFARVAMYVICYSDYIGNFRQIASV